MTVTLIHGDCLEVLKTLDAGSVDAVVTDPPYGIVGGRGQVNLARGKGVYSGAFDDTPDYIRDVVVPIIEQCRRLCGCVVVTPGNKNFALYPQPDSFGCFYQPAAVGLQVFGNLDAQPIFYYGKNATKRNMGKPCSYQLTERPQETGHPCTKPLKAWTRLIQNTTLEGMTILDPFMGSGTTGVACIQTGRSFIGIEISEQYFRIAERRISEAQAQIPLPLPQEVAG